MANGLFLRLNGGSTGGTITLADGSGTPDATGYRLALDGWAPAIAPLRQSTLGDATEYGNVVETLQLHITGATQAAALSNFNALRVMLDQADRWYRGNESVSPVILEYSPEGGVISGTATPLKAAILGAVEENQVMTLPPTFESLLGVGQPWVLNAQVQLLRSGLWLQASGTATSGSVTNGDIGTITFSGTASFSGTATYQSPTQVSWTNQVAGYTIPLSYFVLANTTTAIHIVEAESLTGTSWTSTNGTATHARGGTVKAFSDTVLQTLAGSINPSLTARNFAVFANCYQSGGSAAYIQVGLWSDSSANGVATTPLAPYPSARQWIPLGRVSTSFPVTYMAVGGYHSAGGATTYQIDSIVLVDLDNAKVIGLKREKTIGSPTTETVTVYPESLTRPAPRILNAGTIGYAWNSDINLTSTAGTVTTLLMTNFGETGTQNWRAVSSGSVVLANVYTLVRTNGYLTPV